MKCKNAGSERKEPVVWSGMVSCEPPDIKADTSVPRYIDCSNSNGTIPKCCVVSCNFAFPTVSEGYTKLAYYSIIIAFIFIIIHKWWTNCIHFHHYPA
jgi:hypothetical protein